LETVDSGDKNGETERGNSGLETSSEGVGDLSEVSTLGDVDGSAKTFNGRVEYTESETGYSGLETGKKGIKDVTECAGGGGIFGAGDRRDLSLGSDHQLRSRQIREWLTQGRR
jgi:hypothetical protein